MQQVCDIFGEHGVVRAESLFRLVLAQELRKLAATTARRRSDRLEKLCAC